MRIRSAGIVIKDKKILLIHRKHKGQEFYVFPGGGVEENEDLEKACAREIFEETSIKVSVGHLFCKGGWDGDGDDHFYYLCGYISGEPYLDPNSPEVAQMKEGKSWYNPEWINISEIPKLPVWPIRVRDEVIQGLKNSFQKI